MSYKSHSSRAKRTRVGSITASTVDLTYSAGSTSAIAPLPDGFPAPPAGCESQFQVWGQKWRNISGENPASTSLMQRLFDFVGAAAAAAAQTDAVAAAQANRDNAQDNINPAWRVLERAQVSPSEPVNNTIRRAAKRAETAVAVLAVANQASDKANQVKDNAKRAVDELLDPRRWTALIAPIPRIHSNADKQPTLHAKSAFDSPPVDLDPRTVAHTRQFRRQTLSPWNEYRALRFESFYDEAGIPPGSRMIQDEHHNLGEFIEVELVSRAAAILRQAEPRAKVLVIKGHPTDHADMFLRVDVARNGEDTLSSSVVVEAKVPPGAAKERPAPECDAGATGPSRVAALAPMIDAQFTRKTVDQAHAYSRDARRRVPRDNALPINRRFAFITTFNDWWILRYLDHENVGGSDSRRAPGCARMVRMSHRFTATATDPHVAFAIAFVLYLVAKDLLGEPTGFEWDDDEDAVAGVQAPAPRRSQRIKNAGLLASSGAGASGSAAHGKKSRRPAKRTGKGKGKSKGKALQSTNPSD
ncbi:hypothetical protein IWW54_003889 [Coemansia sp. RSA 2705]|nr:hypothetical protein IWW54_003889 [Coemansia sp. RSA 2705]